MVGGHLTDLKIIMDVYQEYVEEPKIWKQRKFKVVSEIMMQIKNWFAMGIWGLYDKFGLTVSVLN